MKLKEYEEVCPKCKGKGEKRIDKWSYTDKSGKEVKAYLGCKDCKGKGKIDWIDKVKGKEK